MELKAIRAASRPEKVFIPRKHLHANPVSLKPVKFHRTQSCFSLSPCRPLKVRGVSPYNLGQSTVFKLIEAGQFVEPSLRGSSLDRVCQASNTRELYSSVVIPRRMPDTSTPKPGAGLRRLPLPDYLLRCATPRPRHR